MQRLQRPQMHFFKTLCKQLDLPELANDPRFALRADRSRNRSELIEVLSARTSQLTKAEMHERLGGIVPFGPMLTTEEIAHDPHFAARQMIVDVEVPGSAEKMRVAGVPVKMTETPGQVHSRGPKLGEHTDTELARAGLTDTEIQALLG